MRRLRLIFFVVSMLCFKCACAELEIELTQGIDSALPIALLEFKATGTISNPQAAKIHEIIRSDLINSGRFRIPNANIMAKHGNDYDLKNWRRLGVDEVITGNVAYHDANNIAVSYKLRQTHGKKPVLLNKSFKINSRQWRALAHHISDEIYQTLTGDRGYFSTRIAYVLHKFNGKQHRYTLEVADADGHNPKPLLISKQPIMSPSWSPNGKEIAYVSFENKRAAIYRVDVASGKRKLVSDFPGINGAPSWSPDGKKMAIVLSKSGYPKIYVVNLADNSLSKVTQGWSIDTEPSWSPDGNALLFTSNRGGSPQIYQVNLSTKDVTRMSFVGNYNARASYTPDGKSIILLHRDESMFNIAIQELETGFVQAITRSGVDESPSVAPNGKMVLYATRFAGNRVLSLVSVDGRVQLRLPSQSGQVQEPAWSPYLG